MKKQPASSGLAFFASLFLILTLVLVSSLWTIPAGLPIEIARRGNSCGDERLAMATVLSGDQIEFNFGDRLHLSQLANYLEKFFKNKAERLLFLEAAPDESFKEVAKAIDLARRNVDYIAIVTPSAEKQPGECLMIGARPAADYNSLKPLLELKEVPLWRLLWPW